MSKLWGPCLQLYSVIGKEPPRTRDLFFSSPTGSSFGAEGLGALLLGRWA